MPNRRQFIQAAAAAAALGKLSSGFDEPRTRPRLRVGLLREPGFPAIDAPQLRGDPLAHDGGSYLGVADLSSLSPDAFDVFVSPYGSAFPVDAWPALLAYLDAGGNWVNLGGVPGAVPVSRDGAGWRAGKRTPEFHRQLGFTLACTVATSGVKEWRANAALPWTSALAPPSAARTVRELYCRFSSVADTPDESGSAGPMEAAVQPLVSGYDAAGHAVAAPYVCVDRLEGRFAGGRWIFATSDGALDAATLRALVEAASLGVRRFEVRPTLACYRDGERPAVTVGYRGFPREAQPLAARCQVAVFDARGTRLAQTDVPVSGTTAVATASMRLESLPDPLPPGLYRVEASLSLAGERPDELRATTGFWVWDAALLAGGQPLLAGADGFTRGGEPYPVTGTTYMASDVHRKFLLLPNPWLWDRDFAEMKRAGVNLVRTGIWTGWKVLMPRPGEFREDALRALDAWLLTARRHDIPVIFTLFAFLPETWGGENAYLDPRAVAAQRAFVTAIASRYGKMNDLLWDLINEPSFCNRDHLWSCRPNYDRVEREAWDAWIAERHPGADRKGLALPSLDDFKPGSGADERVREYRLFAQATFPRWVREMRAALRASGNARALVTVGQDEAGTNDSPNNLFLAGDEDFTCVHNWWLNDALVWDGVMTKAEGKLNLVEETGVMFSGRPPGIEPRWEEYARNLLERKMVISLAQSAGFVEWVWNSNCYMPSDNEAAIGLLRADRSAKPELEALRGIAAFAAAAGRHLVGREREPVLMVVPHSSMFSTRNTATDATRRAVRALVYGCRVGVSAVSEYALTRSMLAPKVAVVPAESVLHPEAQDTLAAWTRGGTVVLMGPPDEERYARGLADAGIRPAFDVDGADASVLVYAAVFRSAQLYAIASEGEQAVTVRVTPRGSRALFEQRLAPGRAALVLVRRRDGRVLACYPAA
ncbi:MAG: cellulase family glycosylhydrolase [Gemmatimonadales bacterium]